ncbi:hypothetical protein KN10_2876 [Anoxybacillus flavithermus NBRC 109594]|uniref:Uncharacterized protein n=1 Tax=Anoxybacillus flavithermus NBRC 109594 TaxID=1315967 RepID=R4FHG5_9BACL|nr:hypothetical protein KN10_2876 [Anoxybacillus flavithermus NBRC 109594]
MLMTYVISISENETNLFFGCENQKKRQKSTGSDVGHQYSNICSLSYLSPFLIDVQ